MFEIADNKTIILDTPVRARAADSVLPIVRWSFYLFIATIPFETVNPGSSVEPTAVSLGILLASLIFQPTLVFRRPPLAFALFTAYLVVFAAPIVAGPQNVYAVEARWGLLVSTQLVVMCWVAFNLLQNESIARRSLLVLGLSCLALATLQLTGLSQNVSDYGGSTKRVTAFGFHPNNVARILALGLLAFFGLAYASRQSFIRPRWVVWIAFAMIGIAVVQTGSRGALLALGAGIFVYALRSGRSAEKLRNLALVVVAIGFVLFVAFQFENTISRFQDAVDEGDLARREQIFPMAWQLFIEKPLFGWGPVTAQYELGGRLAHVDEETKNAHNMVLNTLITTGLVGAIPLFAGTLLALYAAWKSRNGPHGVLPLSMIIMLIVANMSSNWLSNKMHWFVVAFALSSGVALTQTRNLWRSGESH